MDAVFPIIIAKMIKVLIADDQELIRESLKIILGAHDNIEIVGVVGNGYEVLETLKKHKVDIILMDIRMPKMDGVYCTKLVKEQYPEIVEYRDGDWTLDYSYVSHKERGACYCNLGFYAEERKCVEVIGNIFDNPELLEVQE